MKLITIDMDALAKAIDCNTDATEQEARSIINAVLYKQAPAATEAPSRPFAYYIHIAAEQRGEFVHDLDEALDDLTNCDCKITELFDHATPAPAVGASDWMAHDMAKAFHDAYEELAPEFGYETRSDTKVWDRHSNNGRLMIAVCERIAGPTTPLADEPTEAMCVAMARRVLLNKPDGSAWEDVMRLAYLDARALAAPAAAVPESELIRASNAGYAQGLIDGKALAAVGASVQPAAGALPPVRWWSGVVGSPEKLANLLDGYSEKKESPRRDERVMRAAAKWIREVVASVQPVPASLSDEQIWKAWEKCNQPSEENDWTTGPLPFARAVLALASSTPTKGGKAS